MSPVHSIAAPDLSIRHHHVSPTPETLFPECPDDLSPQQVAGSLVPLAGQHGSNADRATPDCHPAPVATDRPPNHSSSPVRNSAADPSNRAHARLVGIARLAAASPPAETTRRSAERPEYFVLPVKSILNRCDSERVPFEWTINPFRGCEFACKYCYARYTHEYMELDGGEFEKKIYVKKDAGPLLAWDVAHKYSYASEASGGARPDHIAIGTATDPYQPAEREYGVTRACLEELAKREGLSVSIITKSNQIVRDIDVLQRIAERSNLGIDVTITTLRAGLTRLLEPRAPRPDLRLAAVKQFLPFVREKFPRLAKQYQQWYAKNGYAPEEYRRKASERVARIREMYGFRSRPWVEKKHSAQCVQLPLSWDAAAVAQQVEGRLACVAG